ncbi:hypothetical protein [Winogradskyella sp. 3972H.M.0a.05]|uniref:tetratricopeptide repeat protein n=1 Tax=Winogradskyella sp. 3972H.M.0a.05 TaxID=2950277 RepID=UPI00339B2FE7
MKWIFFISLYSFSLFECSYSQNIENSPYEWKYVTIAHKLLQQEQIISDLPSEEFDVKYRLIDSLIDNASIKIQKVLKGKPLNSRKKSMNILNHIDITLSEMSFKTAVRTEYLFQALEPVKIDRVSPTYAYKDKRRNNDSKYYKYSTYINDKRVTIYETERQKEYFDINPSDYFYPIDCDLGAYLYLAIAEVNNLEMHLIQVPSHSLVRLYYGKNKFVNWDNNTAEYFENIEIQNGLTYTSSTRLKDRELVQGKYLKNLSDTEVIGYHLSFLYQQLYEKNKFLEAREMLEKSLSSYPDSPMCMNNLAWVLVSVDKFDNPSDNMLALKLSKKAYSVLPNKLEYAITHSCAYAANGDFKRAKEIQLNGPNLRYLINGFNNSKKCSELYSKKK